MSTTLQSRARYFDTTGQLAMKFGINIQHTLRVIPNDFDDHLTFVCISLRLIKGDIMNISIYIL